MNLNLYHPAFYCAEFNEPSRSNLILMTENEDWKKGEGETQNRGMYQRKNLKSDTHTNLINLTLDPTFRRKNLSHKSQIDTK